MHEGWVDRHHILKENDALWKLCQETGQAAAVVISGGGNFYSTLDLDKQEGG